MRAAAAAVAHELGLASCFSDWREPWNFTSAGQAQQSLIAAGFSEARCRLTPAPVSPPAPHRFLREVIIRPHLQRLPRPEAQRFANAVRRRLGEPLVIDYVRLNIDATA